MLPPPMMTRAVHVPADKYIVGNRASHAPSFSPVITWREREVGFGPQVITQFGFQSKQKCVYVTTGPIIVDLTDPRSDVGVP